MTAQDPKAVSSPNGRHRGTIGSSEAGVEVRKGEGRAAGSTGTASSGTPQQE